ncbi:flagellar biosynthesis protein FlaG [Helicobacter cholecystus]|uniref:Flagellar biosynthesis protein FlaG n=2 Tax=Helicobacter cholecystus TaxID=45498 RepID=A0A3D8IW86_9HELI|nr:FlaG family protein [Helicobacter cholecystus]RDU68841.1 flagellar biosynthesis protein FlaG [Helicobacter cholecystus]
MQNNLSAFAQDRIIDLAKQYGKETSLSPKQKEIQTQLDEGEKKKLKEELVELTKKLNNEMKGLNTDVSFSYNDTVEGLLVTVKEAGGDRVIREIPSKEAIELMKKMQDLVGIIFDKKG